MLIPEYSISNKILNLISEIERSRGYIENTFVLPFAQNSLKKEAKEKKVFYLLQLEDFDLSLTELKRYLDSISPHLDPGIHSILEFILNLDSISKLKVPFEKKSKLINEKLSKSNINFRIKKIPNKTNPEEILAKMTELFGWVESEDAKNTHPLIVSAIILAFMEKIMPFEKYSSLSSHLSSEVYLLSNGYGVIEMVPHQENLNLKRYKFSDSLNYIDQTEDYTEWLEFYLENIHYQINILREKYKLLERQSKEAKIPSVESLTARQQRIYQYLLDYKILQNSSFALLFPDLSEDSILRDLKTLLDKELIIKTGKTKSSRYELKH
jgi:hypothetical protein